MSKWIAIHFKKGKMIMGNVTKKEEVALYTNQKAFIQELESIAVSSGVGYTEYGKKCMVNAYAALLSVCNQQQIQLKDFDGALLRTAFQNIGYTELNFAANECYFDIRKVYEGEGQNKTLKGYSIKANPQGVGNEKLTRKYGVGVKKLHTCWLIREKDKFILPSYNGLKRTDPIWERDIANLNNKVVMVVYPIELKDSEFVEYLIATRESVKSNLVAHIRQNMLYKIFGKQRDDKYAELDADAEKMTLDEMLSSDKWRDWINPNWLSSSSRESMIIRKMQNNALNKYPKEYDSNAIKEAVQSMNEDFDESLNERAKNVVEVDIVSKVEDELKEEPIEESVKDFDVDADGVVVEKETAPKKEEETKTEEVKVEEDYGF